MSTPAEPRPVRRHPVVLGLRALALGILVVGGLLARDLASWVAVLSGAVFALRVARVPPPRSSPAPATTSAPPAPLER